jgi:hypothetical protein
VMADWRVFTRENRVGTTVPQVILLAQASATCGAGAQEVDFNRDVRPILSGYCFKCHGIDDKARKGGLRLDVPEGAVKELKSGKTAVVPGDVARSELVRRIFTEDEDDVMPPTSTKRVLSAEQKEILKRWVAQGAGYKEHWAFVGPRRPELPAVRNAAWSRNPIDRFVLARLEAEGLAPPAEADRYTLARRVYMDLIGLPPTPDEADAFVKDSSPDAYEKLVDRLLASPQYGERWARRWLDLARYADTNGYEKDRPRSMWPYRDWVINAINADMPFDQFTVEQLAGDMLPKATREQKIATGFHRNTMINEEGGADPLEYRFHSMVDRVGTTATTWLGLTVACAQCHTHKYDPITHHEYYGLMAYLNNADEPVMEVPDDAYLAKKAKAEERAKKLEAELAEKFPVEDVKWMGKTESVSAASGVGVRKEGDGSWVFEGNAPEVDTYTFEIESDGSAVDRIRLETLVEGNQGPGRTPHGNFVVTEVGVSVDGQTVKLSKAEASFSQKEFPVAHAIDGNQKTGWAVDGDGRKSRAAIFHFEKPVTTAAGSKWTVRVEQQYGGKHTIRRTRVRLGAKVEDERPLDVRRAEAREKAFSAWEKAASGAAVSWRAIRPATMSSNAPTLTRLGDYSVLVSGDVTKSDTLEVTFPMDLSGITAVRLEALPHPSLPAGGPGKVHYEGPFGDFFLSEISVAADGHALKFVGARESFASKNDLAQKAIDGDQQSGWSINGGQGKAHHAVFVLDRPTGAVKELKFRLLCEKYYAATIGRFRVWVTTDPRAALATPLPPPPPEVENALAVPADARTTQQKKVVYEGWLAVAPQLAAARKQVEDARNGAGRPATTLVMAERPAGHERVTHLHHRGEFLQPKDRVGAGVPAFLARTRAPKDRLTFARWLVSRENPLTARVTVNRHWAAIFGRGIVRTTEDFGFQGELPSHPELLDWLAVEFMDSGWSVKKLHRLIVTSATYRQSSRVTPELVAKDPQNVLLARGARFRADAEVIRDGTLKIAGLLSSKMGGPSVFPPQLESITTEGAYGPLPWKVSEGEDRYRRSIYTFAKRTAPFALYNTFDAPTGEACVTRRDVSNTPLQALSLLNDMVMVEAAQALGRSVAGMKGTDEERGSALIRRCLTRPAGEEEVGVLVEFCRKQRERFVEKELEAPKFAGSTEGDVVENATWTAAARAVMNLDEAVVKQ